ncbi:MAG: hypothetical protein WCK51_02115 [Armatimonadota bacterium]
MKHIGPGICVSLLGSATAFGSDHNNIDKERPLRFDDAYSIAYRSFEFQSGFRLDTFNRERPVYNFRTEVQYGFAKNKDFSIGLEPFVSNQSGKLIGNVLELSYFEGVSREIGNNPAFGYRIDAGLPVSGGNGTEFRVRGILTKTVSHYDRLHLNVDFYNSTSGLSSERSKRIGFILGYSNPVGYPTSFDQTFLAELGFEQGRLTGSGYNSWVGLGIRRQLSATGVLDLGVQLDLQGAGSEPLSPFRLSVGYSKSF